VLIDCPPSLDLLTLNALTAADGISYTAVETTLSRGLRNDAQQDGAGELNPGLKVGGVLLTMFDARTNLAHQVVDGALLLR